MKLIVKQLIAGNDVRIGIYKIYSYGDGSITVRQEGTGLMGPNENATVAGLQRIFNWIESEES